MRKIIRSEIVTKHVSMGGIGPGRKQDRRVLTLECGHVVERKLSRRPPAVVARCVRCEATTTGGTP